jgi:hypothetical protein
MIYDLRFGTFRDGGMRTLRDGTRTRKAVARQAWTIVNRDSQIHKLLPV